MTIESTIGIISGLLAIGTTVLALYKRFKKQPLTELMNQLVDKRLTSKEHQKILKKMNRRLGGFKIKDDYIQKFALKDRGKEAVFLDICISNEIEPTKEICKKILGNDSPTNRNKYYNSISNAFLISIVFLFFGLMTAKAQVPETATTTNISEDKPVVTTLMSKKLANACRRNPNTWGMALGYCTGAETVGDLNWTLALMDEGDPEICEKFLLQLYSSNGYRTFLYLEDTAGFTDEELQIATKVVKYLGEKQEQEQQEQSSGNCSADRPRKVPTVPNNFNEKKNGKY